MNAIIAIYFLALLPVCTGLRCYQCTSGSTGCNDPFSASGAGVTQTSSSTDTSCMKVVAAGSVSRSGSSSCSQTGIYYNTGTTCCSTDLCNGARGSYQTPALLVVSIVALFTKIH